jgi:hypothetical protein
VVVDDNVTLGGDSEHVRPVEGETVALRLTVPAKPPDAVTLIVDAPVTPASMVMFVGLAERLKLVG